MGAKIGDVARLARVSISTVSRAFGMPDLVSGETLERVLAAARQLDYAPSRAAGSLITGRSKSIGLVVADIANPFFPPIIKSAQRRARQAGYALFLADTDEDPDIELEILKTMARDLDGIVICSSRIADSAARSLMANGLLMAFINRTVAGAASVIMDMSDGMRQAVEHLAALGHRHLVYVAGPASSWSNQQRRRAAQTTARRCGLSLQCIGPFAPTIEGGTQAADAALGSGASAAVAFNDLMAIGLLARLADLGVELPHDFGVVGFDNIPQAATAAPPLTTVNVSGEDAGRLSVELLLRMLQPSSAPTRMRIDLPTQLMVRRSTARLAKAAPGERSA